MEDWVTKGALIVSILINAGQAVYGWRKSKAETTNISAETISSLLTSVNTAVSTAQAANEKAEVAEKERAEIRELLELTADEVGDLKALSILNERDYRSQMDEFKIACWEVDGKGKSHGANFTFLDITGIELEEYHATDWLNTVCEFDRLKIKRLWAQMIESNFTTLELRFSFYHKTTGDKTAVEAYVKAYPLPSGKVYKYTARTKPLTLVAGR